jgi:hypothetical protein
MKRAGQTAGHSSRRRWITFSGLAQARAGRSAAASRGAWRSWACRFAAFRASSAARPAGPPAVQNRDWRPRFAAGVAGPMGWPECRDAALDDEVAGAEVDAHAHNENANLSYGRIFKGWIFEFRAAQSAAH